MELYLIDAKRLSVAGRPIKLELMMVDECTVGAASSTGENPND